jgi:hypothetical protein
MGPGSILIHWKLGPWSNGMRPGPCLMQYNVRPWAYKTRLGLNGF